MNQKKPRNIILAKGHYVKAVIKRSYLLALGLGLLFGSGSNAQSLNIEGRRDRAFFLSLGGANCGWSGDRPAGGPA